VPLCSDLIIGPIESQTSVLDRAEIRAKLFIGGIGGATVFKTFALVIRPGDLRVLE